MLLCLVVYLLSMVDFFETRSYWQGGFTKEQQNDYKEHRLSQKGKHLWEQINKLNIIARNLCSTHNVTYCFDKSRCCRRYKHLPFQCEYNDNVTISSYVTGNYDFYDVEQIEEFIAWKGAFEIAYLLQNIDDAPYKYEIYDILEYCFDNYKDCNCYIIKYLDRCSALKEETNALQEPMEEEIAETGSSLDEKEEESEEQKEDLPSNDSNSLTLTLYDYPPCLPKEEESYIVEFAPTTINKDDYAYVESNNFMHVAHDENVSCDSYIVNFIHDATESYYERGT